tara:strand:+ start:38230 stop:38382 length:153 start_codon:yes stop_codon:yes gene_type:complete
MKRFVGTFMPALVQSIDFVNIGIFGLLTVSVLCMTCVLIISMIISHEKGK